jgi:hypothetical protein
MPSQSLYAHRIFSTRHASSILVCASAPAPEALAPEALVAPLVSSWAESISPWAESISEE